MYEISISEEIEQKNIHLKCKNCKYIWNSCRIRLKISYLIVVPNTFRLQGCYSGHFIRVVSGFDDTLFTNVYTILHNP